MDKPNISLVPDIVYSIGSINISSGHMAMFLVTSIVALFCLYVSKTAKLKPTRLQIIFEFMFLWFYEKAQDSFTDKKIIKNIFPIIMTIFLVIIVANLFSIIPLIESITSNGVPIFRSPTSDVSMTLALGLFVVILSHIIALSKNPIKHIGNYINISGFFKAKTGGDYAKALLDFLLGLNDIIGEFAKIISISFRLFGNIFSGIAIAIVFSFLAPYLAPIPFFAIGLFSGMIQAIVFTLLSLQYFSSPLLALEEE